MNMSTASSGRRSSRVTKKVTMRRKIFNIIMFPILWELPRPSNRTVTAGIIFAIFLIPGIVGLTIAIMRAVF